MRDINQILYQVYNSRKTHSYATALPKLANDEADEDDSNTEDTTASSNSKPYDLTNLFVNSSSENWDETYNCESPPFRFHCYFNIT